MVSGQRFRVLFRMNGVGNAFMREPGWKYPPGVEYRFQAQTSGSLLIYDASFPDGNPVFHLLFDCGLGVVNSLLGANIDTLSHVFISHNHVDHIVELDRLYQGYGRSAERNRNGEKFRIPCYCTAETRRTGPDRFYYYLPWDRVDVIPGQPVVPLRYVGEGVYGNPGLGVGLQVTPIQVYHGDPAIVPAPVIWVIEFDDNTGNRKKIVLGWDFLHLVPRYIGEMGEDVELEKDKPKYKQPKPDSPLRDRNLKADGLYPGHKVLREADLLILEGNTLKPLAKTGHTSIEAAVRFTIPALAPKGDTWIVHYSGLEFDREAKKTIEEPLSDEELTTEIQKLRSSYKLDDKYKIVLAKPSQAWP